MDFQTKIANALHCSYEQITNDLRINLRNSIKIGQVELAGYAAEIKDTFTAVYGNRGDKVEVTANYDSLTNKISILIRNAPIPPVRHKFTEDDEVIDEIESIGVHIADNLLDDLSMNEIHLHSSQSVMDFHADLSSNYLQSLLEMKLDYHIPMLTRLLGWTVPPDNCELAYEVRLLLKIMSLDNFRNCLETDHSTNWCPHINTNSLHRVGMYQPDILFTIDVENIADPRTYQAHYVAEAVIDGESQLYDIGFPYNVYRDSRKICKGEVNYVSSPAFVAQWLAGICNYDLCDPFQQTAFPVLDALFRAGVFDDSSAGNSESRMDAIVELLNEWGSAMDGTAIQIPRRVHLKNAGVIPIESNAVICLKNNAPSFLGGTGNLIFGTGFFMDNRRLYAFADGKRQWIFDTNGTYLTQAPIDFQFNHHGI